MTCPVKPDDYQPRMIPNPLWCETCEGRGYLVGDVEWEPYAVACHDCKGRRFARSHDGDTAMKTYRVTIEAHGYDLVLQVPPEVMTDLGVEIGEELEWHVEGKSIVLHSKRRANAEKAR